MGFYSRDDPGRERELYRMFIELRRQDSSDGAAAAGEARLIRPSDVLLALRVAARDPAVESLDRLKARAVGAVSIFEGVALYERQQSARVVNFDRFAATFDDVLLPVGAAKLVLVAITLDAANAAAQRRVLEGETEQRRVILDAELEGRQDIASVQRQEFDIAQLRRHIQTARHQHIRRLALDEFLDGPLPQSSAAASRSAPSFADTLEELKAEVALSKQRQEESRRGAVHFERACTDAEEIIQRSNEQLGLLRKWLTTALDLTRQQCNDSVDAVVQTVNQRPLALDECLTGLESRLQCVCENLIVSAVSCGHATAVREHIKEPQHADFVAMLSEGLAGRLSWRFAAAFPLNSPQLLLCDPANTDPAQVTTLRQHLSSTLSWLFRSYALGALSNDWNLIDADTTDGLHMTLAQFECLVADHKLDVPGTPRLFFSEYTRDGLGVDVHGFEAVLRELAFLIHGSRLSSHFATHCLVQTAIECRQPRLILARLSATPQRSRADGTALREETELLLLATGAPPHLSTVLLDWFERRSMVFSVQGPQPDPLWRELRQSILPPTAPAGQEAPVALELICDFLENVVFNALFAAGATSTLGSGQMKLLCQQAILLTIAALAFTCGADECDPAQLAERLLGLASDDLGVRSVQRSHVPRFAAALIVGGIVALVRRSDTTTGDGDTGAPSLCGIAMPLLAIPLLSSENLITSIMHLCTLPSRSLR